jgi:hypothetical protein
MAVPVQDLGSGFWLGHLVTRVNSFFLKKNQNNFILEKKNKSQRVATGFLTGSYRVNRIFPSSIFFNSARFQPRIGRIPGRPAGSGQASKLWSKHLI